MKKISMILCLVLFISALPTMQIQTKAEGLPVSNGFFVYQDYDNAANGVLKTAYPSQAAAYVDTSGGVADLRLDPTMTANFSAVTEPAAKLDFNKLPAQYNIEFDLNVINCSVPFVVGASNPTLGDKAAYLVRIFPGTFADIKTSTSESINTQTPYGNTNVNKWYSFKIEVNEDNYDLKNHTSNSANNGVFKVYYKEKTATEYKELSAYTAGNFAELANYRPGANTYGMAKIGDATSGIFFKVAGDDFTRACVTYKDDALTVANDITDAHYQVDNVKIYTPGLQMTDSYFRGPNSETTVIPSGSIKGFSKICNTAESGDTVYAKLQAYNHNDEMIADSNGKATTVAAGSDVTVETETLDLNGLSNLKRVDMTVWNIRNGEQQIIGTKSIYDAPVIVDNASDGSLEWMGYTWTGECVLPEYDNQFIYNTQPCPHDWIFVDDNGYLNFVLEHSDDENGKHHRVEVPRRLGATDNQVDLLSNFDIEFEMRILEENNNYVGFQMYDGNMRVYLVFDEDGITYQDENGTHTANVISGNEWVKWRGERRGDIFNLYMNGELVVSYILPTLSSTNTRDGAIRFYATPYKKISTKMQLKSLTLQQYEGKMEMVPNYNDTYDLGSDIEFKAEVIGSPEYVEYYVGNVCIGKATSDTEYAYTLYNAHVGTYSTSAKAVYADGSEKTTFTRTFSVSNYEEIELLIPEKINLGESAELSVINDGGLDLTYVEYYVNGNLAGTSSDDSFKVTVSGLKAGSADVYALAYLSDGTYVISESKYINVVTSQTGTVNISREYELSYKYESGSGAVTVKDGHFELNMTHSENGVTYVTRDGVTTHASGAGVYRAVVSAGIADVYRDGQLAFSYYMPRNTEASVLNYSGVSEVSLGGSGVKTEVYSRKIGSEKEFTAEGINMDVFYSLEFDKMDSSDETILLYDGQYEISMKLKNGITVLAQPTTASTPVEQKLTDSIEPGYYRITVYRGLANIFVDNRFVASFRAPLVSHKPTLRRVMSKSGASTFTAIKNSDDVFYFEDDFQQDNEREAAEHWYNIHGDATATFADGVMNLTGTGTYLLDATAENPTLKWNMALNLTETEPETSGGSSSNCEGGSSAPTVTITKSGEFAVVARYRNEYNNVKIHYNHNGGVWSVIETTEGTGTTVATETKELTNNVAYDYVLDIKNDKLTFTCGNDVIFTDVELGFLGNGKYGFAPVSSNGATIDNLSYVGNGKVNTGVNYSWFTSEELGGTAEYIKGQNGEVVMYQVYDQYETTDMGANWNTTTGSYSGLGYAANMVHLQSGRYLSISDWGEQSHASLYEADGTCVKSNILLQEADDKVADRHGMGGRVMQSRKVWGTAADAEPRVFYITSEGAETDGTTRVYYSDNEGLSWTESTTVLDFDNMGEFYAGEADIVDMPDGRIRVWLRCNRGFLHYTDSYDGGVTFSNVPTASQFMTPSTAFSIERDPEAEETYYIIWEYDITTAALEYIQQPRNRTAMAVSYDGMESWEYIMEMDDLGPYRSTSHMNSCIRVIDGIVYANNSYLDAIKYTDERTIKTMVYVLDPSKINTTKRFTNAHVVFPDYSTVYDDAPTQVVLPKEEGTAMIYNNMVPTDVNDEGMVEVSVVARAVCADYETTDNGVILTLGAGEVRFTKGSKTYSINGKDYINDEICLSADGGYLNVEICSKIFGKQYSETESSYILMSTALSESYRNELEDLVAGVPNDIRLCVQEFKTISSVDELKKFFEKYEVLLNLETDFTDKSYENMYDAYTQVELALVVDYDSMQAALDALISAEKGRVDEFVSVVNTASANSNAAAIKTYLTESYVDMLSFTVDTSAIINDIAIYQKMTGVTYYSIEQIENAFKSAFVAQYYAENGKTNAISLSTPSQGFEGWNAINSNEFGGVTIDIVEGETVATLSAYEGIIEPDKTAVEAPIENGKVYYAPGTFDSKAVGSNATVDSENGTVYFDNQSSSFKITGTAPADSYTMITVFDMSKPQGTVTATFSSGFKKASIDFAADATSIGELPDELKDAEKLTYRAELSMSSFTLLAKSADAADTEYYVIGSIASTNVAKTKWSVNFAATSASTELSNIGIYSALSSVRYNTDGYELLDDIYYSFDGEEGHTMSDLAAVSGALVNNITVDENGVLVLSKSESESNAVVNIVSGNLLKGGNFDRAEMNLRVSADTGGRIFLYYCDRSYFREGDMYFSPNNFDGKDNGYSGAWTTNQYYDIKMITEVVGYDTNGQARTSVSMYVKKADETEWICVALDQMFTVGQRVTDPQIKFMNTINGKNVYFKKIDIKTYKRASGNYEYINNTVDMPTVDYIYSFDYVRMDDNVPTVFTIGGSDYCQTFTLEPYRITSNLTDSVKADIDIAEDKWYRFYGKVTMTEEAPHVHNSSKITKNKISLYMEDSDGNVTTIFENLPMLKVSGNNGMRFKMADTFDAGIRLKNIRVYNGKTLEIINYSCEDETASITIDFLNDDVTVSDDFTVIGGVYFDEVFGGSKVLDVINDIGAYDAFRINLTEIPVAVVGESEPMFKVFAWEDMENFVPLTSDAESGTVEEELQLVFMQLGL